MKIVIGCDNAGWQLKERIVELLRDKEIEVEDVSCESEKDLTYYPLIAQRVCQAILSDMEQNRGIIICGTGIGMAITANKYKGIRAAVCHDNYSCERSVLSNNCNVLCLGERVIGVELAKKIVSEWITLRFKDGSSTPKIEAIKQIESENFIS